MTVEELARMVKEMRRAQADYFKGRTPQALNVARDYERRVDRAVAEVLGGQQKGLFDGGEVAP